MSRPWGERGLSDQLQIPAISGGGAFPARRSRWSRSVMRADVVADGQYPRLDGSTTPEAGANTMTIELTETHESARELYLVPPSRFIAARDELVRRARTAGNAELARELAALRRPARSAWLVNLLARYDGEPLGQLVALGRRLRHAQTRLETAELVRLRTERQQLIADLVARARLHSIEAGAPAPEAVLMEVEATLNAALVDLAGSFTISSGHLVRPMSHNGFGPMPQVEVEPGNAEGGSADAGRWHLHLVDNLPTSFAPDPPAPAQTRHDSAVRQAEAELATLESAHWQSEHELADAESALESAVDRIDWLDSQRIEARRDKVTAEQRLALARSVQRDAIRAVAEARRRLDAALRDLDR